MSRCRPIESSFTNFIHLNLSYKITPSTKMLWPSRLARTRVVYAIGSLIQHLLALCNEVCCLVIQTQAVVEAALVLLQARHQSTNLVHLGFDR